MLATLRRTMGRSSEVRSRALRTYALLIAFNVVAWAIALLLARGYPLLLPTALLAYSFGLRHAVDADHIAAIDNTTRKLMQDGERPVAVGLFFSLGHSTIVVILSVVIAISAGFVAEVPTLQEVGGLIGTIVSATFLLVIGTINLVVLIDIYRMFRRVASGGAYDEETLEDFLANRGLLARLLRPMLRIVRKSWHMYPLGLLFGLGFDTASEVALLGLAATTGASGLPVVDILILPALFAAGMSLVDTTDGILMLGAYGWAYVKPIRKLYYNLTITLMSVLVAFLIGGIEVLGIVADRFDLRGGAWDWVGSMDFGALGFAIVAIFALSWIISTAIYRWKAWDDLPVLRSGGGPPARDGAD
jgi:high-affinity nickel-transport protein